MRDMKKTRMEELIEILNKSAKAYYQEAQEIMSNFEYDKLYDELESLEKESGVIMASSPTVNVGYEVLSELPKERHTSPMLSLDKTKEVSAMKEFSGDKKCVLSWKLDGLTIVLSYENGRLQKAVTRGNGEIGEVITNNAKTFVNLPLQIPYKGELVLRGEAVISYDDFAKINEQIEDEEAKYKNPRNLCSGSVRQLNSEITANRSVRFCAFQLVYVGEEQLNTSREEQLLWLKEQGFETVVYRCVTKDTVEEETRWFESEITKNPYPSDGLVLCYDDIVYGKSLGQTSKFPRDSIAFKWVDEIKETTLLEMEWSPSRTGLINPVAIFEPVELEGTTVSRASVHNISVLEELELGIGDRITVYKANMIIPQIAENLTRSKNLELPQSCPACGQETSIKQEGNARTLNCENPECVAKRVKSFVLMVGRDALNIEGLSEATLEKFIEKGFIHEYADLFHLEQYEEAIKTMEGFGEKSYDNLQKSVEQARTTTLPKVIYSLGIPNIGLANAKMICKEFANDIHRIIHASKEELEGIDGVGAVIAETFTSYFAYEKHVDSLQRLLEELTIPLEEKADVQIFEGVTFVITGSVHHFQNRREMKALIESKGGKVTGSVTAKTNYLINNELESSSSKNKKAKELGIPILSEEMFLELLD